jgi:hypothetical protein
MLIGLILVACGGEDEATPEKEQDGSDASAVALAAQRTEEAGSYRTDMRVTMEGLAPEPVTLTAEGLFDANERRGRMTMDMSRLSGAAGGVDLGEIEIVMDGLVMYMRMPFLQQLRPGIKPWIRFDLEKIGKQQGFDLQQLTQLGDQSNPAQALVYLRAASDDVEEVGAEEVRGVETTHYRMTVDLDKVAARAPAEQREAVRTQIRALKQRANVEKVPVEVWVDDDGLVRREVLRYEDMRFAPGQTGDMTIRMELYDFGVTVDAEPPPGDQVTDLGELLGGG